MKKEWQQKALGEMCDIRNGSTPSKSNPAFWNEGTIPWFTIDDMREQGRSISRTRQKITQAALNETSVKLLPADTVLLCCTASVGEFAITRIPVTTNQQFNGLVVKDRKQIEPYFLFHYAATLKEELLGLSGKTTIDFIPISRLRDITIPVPPLAEQHRIVGLLDEAFAGLATAKANAEKNLQNARALFESHLQSVFTQRGEGWVEKPLSELCDIKHGFAFEGEFFYNRGNYVLLTPGNFHEKGGYRDRGEKQKYYTGPIPRDYVLNEGDLLIAMTEQAAGLLGSPIIVPESDKFLHNQRLGLVKHRPEVPWSNEFFFHVFNTQQVRRDVHASASGVKVRHTSPTKIGEVVVGFPTSISEQTKIVTTLNALATETKRLASLYQQMLAALAALKKSLLHQAFAGELTRKWRESKIVAFPITIPNISATDLHAGILAMAFRLHEQHGKQTDFNHVKAEKIAHMVEAHLGIDLGRSPVKDAAGPNDFKHLKGVEHRAKMAGYFLFHRVDGAAYQVTKYSHFDDLVSRTECALGDRKEEVDQFLNLMLRMDWRKAEIFATVYAAWNNLLLDGETITDERIVLEARERWHPEKMNIPRERFFGAVEWMRKEGFVPLGKGKRVNSKAKS